MPTTSDIQIAVDLRNPQLDDEAWEKLTQSLRRKMLDLGDFQQINYPILWGGQHERSYRKALMLPTPQEVVEYFFICQSLDEVKDVKRILDPNLPAGNKALGAILVGLLTAEVNAKNIKAMFRFLSRLVGKTIAMDVEANAKKLKVTASSQQELFSQSSFIFPE